MSADNGYIVTRLYDDDKRIGIFYYCASSDEPPQHYTEDHTILKDGNRMVFDDPVKAIVEAHKIERDDWTEYGVSVHPNVLKEV